MSSLHFEEGSSAAEIPASITEAENKKQCSRPSEFPIHYAHQQRGLYIVVRLPHRLWWASLVDEATLRAWIVNMGRREALVRIAHLVCEMHARLRNVGLAGDGAFELPLTQEELADALGLTAVHVNRTLKELHARGAMSFKRQQIVIEDLTTLRRIAEFDPNYLHLPRADVQGTPLGQGA